MVYSSIKTDDIIRQARQPRKLVPDPCQMVPYDESIEMERLELSGDLIYEELTKRRF